MGATTPHMEGIDLLEPLASRYVDVTALPWKPTPSEGIDMKVLLEDKESGHAARCIRNPQVDERTRVPAAMVAAI